MSPSLPSSTSLQSIPLVRIDGRATSLADFHGKVLLIVNVASACGLTPQYAGLQALYAEKRAQGLEILGFPCNDFGAQEPGTESEIAAFCTKNYGVEFPMFRKLAVKGAAQHPLYAALIAAKPQPEGEGTLRTSLQKHGLGPVSPKDVVWNFEKFVVGRDGNVLARFLPDVTAEDAQLRSTLDSALAQRAA